MSPRPNQRATSVVTAPVAGGAYPRSTKWNEITAQIHAVELDSTGTPVKVLCGKVKPESILDDHMEYNRQGVTCPVCARRLIKLATPK